MLVIIALIVLVIVLFIAAVLPLDDVDVRWKTIKAMYKLPGPVTIPFIGLAYLAATLPDCELFNFLTYYCRRYPRLTSTYMFGIPFVAVQEPEDLEALLGSVNHISKGYEYDVIRKWLREGLLVSTGDKWHQRRRLLTPAFHFRILEDNLQSLNKHARYLVRNMLKLEGKPFNAPDLVTLCTLDVICETAMGFSLKSQDNKGVDYLNTVKRVAELMVLRVRTFWMSNDWMFGLSKHSKPFKGGLKLLHAFTEKIIKERKLNYKENAEENKKLGDETLYAKNRKAFLDIILEIDRKHPNLLTDLDIREEVDTFMFEGHDTTSSALAFALFLLGSHPQIQEKAYKELYDIFGDSTRPATNKDLHEMHYLEMIIKETLRMYPSVPYFSRKLTQDLNLAGNVVIPEGAHTVILPYLLHRDPRYYSNPDVFDPERFSLENSKTRHPYAYLPFSAGPRNCIGQKFAMMEMKIVLSTVLRYVQIEAVTKMEEIQAVPFLIIRSLTPVQIKAISRNVITSFN